MKFLIASMLLAALTLGPSSPAAAADGGTPFACNMKALTKAERAAYPKLSRALLSSVEEMRELEDGYGFRFPPTALKTAAEWVGLERRCCPFFTFAIELARDDGPMWLKVTGPEGVKPFIRVEFGLE